MKVLDHGRRVAPVPAPSLRRRQYRAIQLPRWVIAMLVALLIEQSRATNRASAFSSSFGSCRMSQASIGRHRKSFRNSNLKDGIQAIHHSDKKGTDEFATDIGAAQATTRLPARRTFVRSLLATTTASTLALASWPQSGRTEATLFDFGSSATSTTLPTGLLESRVVENLLSPPPYGMEGSDIMYPAWFQGTWNVASTTASVEAPCGLALFGSNATYVAARNEVGTTLSYESRFVASSSSTTTTSTSIDASAIADREYNVKSIAKASLGTNSVVDIPLATPNRFTAILAPKGAPGLLQVDLLIVRRRQEIIDASHFHCSEVVREIVSPAGSGGGGGTSSTTTSGTAPTVFKEIETTSLYTLDDRTVPARITCRQRSASFLLPVQTDVMRMRMWEYARGRPVDVRFYDVVYTKKV